MDEPTDSGNRLIAFVLIGAVIISAWSWWRLEANESVQQSVGVFVPSPEAFDRRQSHVQHTRQLVDLVNSRQGADEEYR